MDFIHKSIFTIIGKLSVTLSGFFHLPKSDSKDDRDAAERANQFEV